MILAIALGSRQNAVMASTPQGARALARDQITRDIKAIGRQHLADYGAAALSLRAVARDAGMVSSAVYRYFPSRDDLLTALIVDAYDAVGAVAEKALDETRRRSTSSRWIGIAADFRAWASAHQHEYALLYGSPVPGYAAPGDTISPAARVPLALLALLAEGIERGEIQTVTEIPTPRSVHSDFAAVRIATAMEIPDAVLSRGLLAWAQLLGTVGLELFGHLHNVIHEYDAFFQLQMQRTGRYLENGD